MIESPQGFVVSTERRKAAFQNGFRRVLGPSEGWAHFASTTATETLMLAAGGSTDPWYLALDHWGVISELNLKQADLPGPGLAGYRVETLTELYEILPKVYALALSLPDGPLETFLTRTQNLPKTTEVERLVIQRVGQDIFRERLLVYWGGRCSLTGITDTALLRASHIIPWKDCESDADRLQIHNGLLLSALWDASFDRGLVTFDPDGPPVFSATLSPEARAELRWHGPLHAEWVASFRGIRRNLVSRGPRRVWS
jgi:hypothetical protein